MTIKLVVKDMGHVPSFKNSKLICRGRPITKPEYQRWMKAVTASFAWQLRCALATSVTGIMTGPYPLSLIASSLPLDDSRKWIPSHSVSTLLVSKGCEGADIEIEVAKP